MRSKWHKFNSQYSPLVAATVSKGTNNICLDWKRLADEDATINGVSLKNYVDRYNTFTTKDDVKNFFKEVILQDLKKDIDKEQVATNLLEIFHQGGLMYPVSAPMSMMLCDEAGLQARASKNSRQTSITCTEDGFKVQELYTSREVTTIPFHDKVSDQLKILAEPETGIVSPDPGKDFIIKAGASVDVDFSLAADNPSITLESNYISYGNKAVESVLDKRNFGQIIVDFFRNIVGLNAVKDISAGLEKKNTVLKSKDASVEEGVAEAPIRRP